MNNLGKRTLVAVVAVLGLLVSACGSDIVNGYEVKSIAKPWVEDGPGGTVPNGCDGDGVTWAIAYYTIKDKKRVQAYDEKLGRNVDVVLTDCVGEARAGELKVGGPYVR